MRRARRKAWSFTAPAESESPGDAGARDRRQIFPRIRPISALFVRCATASADVLAGSRGCGGGALRRRRRRSRRAVLSRRRRARGTTTRSRPGTYSGPRRLVRRSTPTRELAARARDRRRHGRDDGLRCCRSSTRANVLEYVFSDITPLFTEQVKLKFGDRAYCAARPLDIERDPVSAGLRAARVRHHLRRERLPRDRHRSRRRSRTSSASSRPAACSCCSSSRVRRPGSIWIFGLTPGWWRFADRDLRPSHPLLGGDSMASFAYARSGFDDVVAVADCGTRG